MAKTRTIPTTENPWVCCINGVVYSYKAGTSQSVPDEVAELIDIIDSAVPKEAPAPGSAGQVWTRDAYGIVHWADAPTYTLPSASASAIGGVKKGSAVANATDAASVITQLNALIASLVASGAVAEYVAP